jgi:dihydrofolate reductase
MKLSNFNIICQVDSKYGMSHQGCPPYEIEEWRRFVTEKTTGCSDTLNYVLMGKNTFEVFRSSNPSGVLNGRSICIISKTIKNDENCIHPVYKNITDCLTSIASMTYHKEKTPDVWVIGGASLIESCLLRYTCYINKIILCSMKYEYKVCDTFFPYKLLECYTPKISHRQQNRYEYKEYNINELHPDTVYIKTLCTIIAESTVHGKQNLKRSRFNLSFNYLIPYGKRGFTIPIITLRDMKPQKILHQLIDDLKNTSFDQDTIGFRLRSDEIFIGLKDYHSACARESITADDMKNDPLHKLILDYSMSTGEFSEMIRFNGNKDRDEFPLEYIKLDVPSNKDKLNLFIQFNKVEMLIEFPFYHTYLLLLFCILSKRMKLMPGVLSFSIGEGYIHSEKDNLKRAETLIDYTPKPPAAIVMPIDFNNFSDLTPSNHIYIKDYECWSGIKFD